jgi:hypothetical protein
MSKKNHHNPDYLKNTTADVIKHGSGRAVPNEQWEVNMNLTPAGYGNAWGAFLPQAGKNRPTPHVKTNECDH